MMAAVSSVFAAAAPTYRVTGADALPWGRIFASIGMPKSGNSDSVVVVAGAKQEMDVGKLAERHIVVLEGNTAARVAWGSLRKQRRWTCGESVMYTLQR
jgi:hypothetical protein